MWNASRGSCGTFASTGMPARSESSLSVLPSSSVKDASSSSLESSSLLI